ncbi:MAG: lipoprotein [Immundisolibacter sp.]|uniref:LPS translocon maturation chaperone LptM n=1 Tax=Immundisolibacter sp. TaxID=1934948 RepID=UPI003D12D283
MSRYPGRSLAAVGLLLLLSGCGQTGPLYMPPPEAPAQAPAAEATPPAEATP